MGVRTSLARRRNENRIRRKTRSFDRKTYDTETELDQMIDQYSNGAYRLGKRMFDMSQARKAEGKQILKQTLKHGIGVTYRGIMGSKKTSPKKSRRNRR